MQCLDLKRDGQFRVQALRVPFTASVIWARLPRFKMEIRNLCRWVVMSQTPGDMYRVHRLTFFFLSCLGKRVFTTMVFLKKSNHVWHHLKTKMNLPEHGKGLWLSSPPMVEKVHLTPGLHYFILPANDIVFPGILLWQPQTDKPKTLPSCSGKLPGNNCKSRLSGHKRESKMVTVFGTRKYLGMCLRRKTEAGHWVKHRENLWKNFPKSVHGEMGYKCANRSVHLGQVGSLSPLHV